MDAGLISAMCFAYLFGSVNSAIIVCKLMGLPSPIESGSFNPGATNVLRIGGRQAALFTLLGDAAKGLIPMWIAQFWDLGPFGLGVTALVAVLGHIFPIFFDYKGGKGIATSLGCALGLNFFVGFIMIALWACTAYFTRISSLSALVATAALPVLGLIFVKWTAFVPLAAITGVVFWRHKENIERLRAGTEGKINWNVKTPEKKEEKTES